jgi:hypothetical protein
VLDRLQEYTEQVDSKRLNDSAVLESFVVGSIHQLRNATPDETPTVQLLANSSDICLHLTPQLLVHGRSFFVFHTPLLQKVLDRIPASLNAHLAQDDMKSTDHLKVGK